jgi:hypothetical protein
MIIPALLTIAVAAEAPQASRAQRAELAQKTKLAKALCSHEPSERRAATDAVVADPGPVLPWLLAWAKCPIIQRSAEACRTGPPVGSRSEPWCMFEALTEIFGRLRTKEAIPYLVENISYDAFAIRKGDPLLHKGSLAIRALIQIGPDATPALLEALPKWQGSLSHRSPSTESANSVVNLHRLGILVALTHLEDPRARSALEQYVNAPDEEGRVARDGLARLEKKK